MFLVSSESEDVFNIFTMSILVGCQFKSISSFTSLVPNPKLGIYPYSYKTSGSSSNVFLGKQLFPLKMISHIENKIANKLLKIDTKLRIFETFFFRIDFVL